MIVLTLVTCDASLPFLYVLDWRHYLVRTAQVRCHLRQCGFCPDDAPAFESFNNQTQFGDGNSPRVATPRRMSESISSFSTKASRLAQTDVSMEAVRSHDSHST